MRVFHPDCVLGSRADESATTAQSKVVPVTIREPQHRKKTLSPARLNSLIAASSATKPIMKL